jgi:hypothetical protein
MSERGIAEHGRLNPIGAPTSVSSGGSEVQPAFWTHQLRNSSQTARQFFFANFLNVFAISC